MKNLSLIVLSVFPLFLFAQDLTFKGEYSYKKARIFQQAKPVLRVNDLEINNDVFTYKAAETGTVESFNFHDKVYLIKAAKGNHLIKYGIFMGLSTGLVSALILSDHYNDPFAKDLNDGAIIGGSTIGGALLGALIGGASPKWKTVFENGTLYAEAGLLPQNGLPGFFALNYTF